MTRSTRLFLSCLLIPWTGLAGDVVKPSSDTPYDQCTWLATHNSYANLDANYFLAGANQPDSVTDQLDYGVRVLNPDIWLIRQKKNRVGVWRWEAYTGDDDVRFAKDSFFDGISPQVVVGHGLDFSNHAAINLIHNNRKPYPSLTAFLNTVGSWAQKHPDHVVTLQFETKVASQYESRINTAIANSGIANRIFRPVGSNTNVPAPAGRTGGWSVEFYGYPPLSQLTQAKRNVVLFPSFPPKANIGTEDNPTNRWTLEAQTVYGNPSLPNNDQDRSWVLPRTESMPLDDFTRPLCSIVHAPDLPQPQASYRDKINTIALLRAKWEDFRNLYNRLPTALWVDYYDRGNNGPFNPGAPPGPAMFVNEMNDLWSSTPAPVPAAEVSPNPSAHGWHNTDVAVVLSAPNQRIQAMLSTAFGATRIRWRTNQTYLFKNEGTNTTSFYAVGQLGKRSALQLLDVNIDRTPPSLVAIPDRPPDQNGWYTSNVTVRFECFDALSGIATCPDDVVVSGDGVRSVSGTAVDRADNQATTVTNINIDTRPPVICVIGKPELIWPPNGKPVGVVICGTITDAGSGVDRDTPRYSLKDEYHRIDRSGRIALGNGGAFRITIPLEARRSGRDRDGRDYLICITAADRAGHSSEEKIKVTVPHDQRSH